MKTLSTVLLVCFFISGWFYINLKYQYGSFTAFNGKPADSFLLQNQPPAFYFGSGNGRLFSNPTEPAFSNQFFPVFHSEVWGDYWAVFVNYGKATNVTRFVNGYDLHPVYIGGLRLSWIRHEFFNGTNYLARVNLIALFPALLALAAFLFSLARAMSPGNKRLLPNRRNEGNRLGLLFILLSFCGYFWFLIMYPSLSGNTIKASYVLQVFPIIALLVGYFMDVIRTHTRLGYRILISGLILVFAHNIFAMITHYWFLRLV